MAFANTLAGWVLNGDQGVEIHLEGDNQDMEAFVREMRTKPPAAASISDVEVEPALCEGLTGFTIRESHHSERPTVRVSPDLPIWEDCLQECLDPANPVIDTPISTALTAALVIASSSHCPTTG
jgi:hydrogenase maturation protein HypF